MMKLDGLHGIIHIGANTGQERGLYANNNLNVLWIEPIPEAFAELERNLIDYPKQRALQYLVGNEDGKILKMHICNNEYLSSSIMPMARHSEYYPTVVFNYDIDVEMWTLDSIIVKENIDLGLYDGMVVDVQGAEAMVLHGAKITLGKMKRVQVESANFELYKDYPTPDQLAGILKGYGMRESGRDIFNNFGTAKCFDIVYVR